MYKRFVSESSGLEPLRDQCDSAGARGDPEVDELWTRIDARIGRARAAASAAGTGAAAPKSRRQWGTARIFISSTFKDFFPERESLVKRVFPSLREWCEKRRIALYDYDLRWGVPKDSTGSHAVRTCLELLDRCLAETEGRAFFLGLVGDRFGWVPGPADLEEDLQRRYDWTFGSSVTQVEVVHGAIVGRSPNALFMIRDSACYSSLPDALRRDYVEPAGSTTGRHVARQKLEVMKRFPPDQVRQYTVQYAGTVKEGKRERVQFSGLEDFEQRVLDFFQRTITAEFPLHTAVEEPGTTKPSEGQVEESESNETHIGYMFSLAGNAQGQAACQRLLRYFVEADSPDAAELPPLFGDLEEEAVGAAGLKALVIGGDTGAGKTTALARLGQQFADREGYHVMAHFSQFSPASGESQTLKTKLTAFFKGFLPVEEASAFTGETIIQDILEAVARLSELRFLVLIDAYECFFESVHPRGLLPLAWPTNVRCVVSCLKDNLNRCFGELAVHLYNMEPLEPDACRAVCRGYLDEFGKRLDATQLAALLGKASAANPLWLTQACEELRVFGDYAAVSQVITEFPDETRDLLKSIAARILKDSPDGLVSALLALVGVSRVGLWEKYARQALRFAVRRSGTADSSVQECDAAAIAGSAEAELEEVPLADYLRARRETKAFLRSVASGSVYLTFQHWVSRTAVQDLLLAEPEVAQRWHSLMADFIQTCGRNSSDAALTRDLPHHLYQSDRRTELHKILSNDSSTRHIALRIPMITSSYVYNSWRCRYPKVTPSSKQATLVVCTFCKYSPTRMGTQKCNACVYCSRMVMQGQAVPAGTCNMHQAQLASMARCWYCGRIDPNSTQLQICGMCNNMNSPSWCCQPVLETDRQFQSAARGQLKRTGLMW